MRHLYREPFEAIGCSIRHIHRVPYGIVAIRCPYMEPTRYLVIFLGLVKIVSFCLVALGFPTSIYRAMGF